MSIHETITYESWNEFISDYSVDLFHGNFIPYEFIFRGQAKAEWSLISSFDRLYGTMPWTERNEIEVKLLDNFKVYCTRENIILSSDDNGIKSLAQHYGVPTRLLDWTYSPFIAAYFAFSSHLHDDSDNVAIWALRKEHNIWKADFGVSINEDTYVHENIHQRKQLGCFTIMKNQEASIDGFLESCEKNNQNTKGALVKIIIPASEYKNALYGLSAMNINAMSVYGGLEGCAQAAKDMVDLLYR